MPQELKELELHEVSLVDHPANSSVDDSGKKVPRARVALFKRDSTEEVIQNFESLTKEEQDEFTKAIHGKTQGGVTYPKSDFAYTPDDVPSHWKLRLTKTPGGNPDPGIVGAAVAALGKGFRGNKVSIPSSDMPSVKAKVLAAWKKANPDKGGEELPNVLKGRSMTLAELEVQVTKQEGILATITAENNILKQERDLVIKMSKKQRKAYASMSPDMQKEFMAGDDEKKKSMCNSAMQKLKEKAAEDSMDEALKSEFAKAGTTRRMQMIADQLKKMEKEADAEGGSNEDMMDKKKGKKKAATGSQDDDEDPEEDDNQDLELRKNNAVLTDRVVKAEQTLLEISKRERLSHFTKMAEDKLPNSSGTAVEKGADLMTVADMAPGGENGDVFKRYLGNLETADKAMTKLYGEVGKAGGGVIPAEKVFYAKVDEIAKRDKVNIGKATEICMSENPELYIAYEQQQRTAIARS